VVGPRGAGLFLEIGEIERSNFCGKHRSLDHSTKNIVGLFGKCSPFWEKNPLVFGQFCACGPYSEFFCAQTVAPAADPTSECYSGQTSLRHPETKPEIGRSPDFLRIFQNGVSDMV
jgi:hypothetical protein